MLQQRITTWCLTAVLVAWGASAKVEVDGDLLMKALATYEWGQSDAALTAVDSAIVAAKDNEAARRDLEVRLAGLLRSTATRPAKHFACQKLAQIGTKQCVPAVAELLADKDLAHIARWALEAIPDDSAAAALRDALPKLAGGVKVGAINSLGIRRDAASVAAIGAALGDADSQVALAAAAALAKIGTPDAARAVFAFKPKAPVNIRADVSVACVEAAEALTQTGARDEAAKRFEELLAPTEAPWIQAAAFRGLIAAQPQEAYQRVMAALRGDDPLRRAVAGQTIRTAPDPKPYADVLTALPPAAQVILLDVLVDRGYAAARDVVVTTLASPDESVRATALRALGSVGMVEDVPTLAAAAGKPAPEGDAARAALTRIKAAGANKAVVVAMSQPAAARAALLGVLLARWAVDELPAIVRCGEDPQPAVRGAAVTAIGAMGGNEQAGDLVKFLQKTQVPDERAAIESALLSVCGRGGAACAPHLAPLGQSSDGRLRVIAVHGMAACGGQNALAAVRAAIEDQDETVGDEAVRTLSSWPNRWPEDAGAAEPLLTLARSARKPAHQVLALRGYLQCVSGDKGLSAEQKAAKVDEVLPLVTRAEEKRLAIAAIGALPTAGALEMLATFAADTEVSEEACVAIVNLAGRSDVRDVSRQQRQKALQAAAKNAKTEATKKQAEDMLRAVTPSNRPPQAQQLD